MAFPETTYISFLIITASLRIQQKFYLNEELIEDGKGSQALPKFDEWQDFLTNDRNKEQLCSLLVNYFVSDKIVTEKTIYATKGSLCLMKTLYTKVNKWSMNYVPATGKRIIGMHKFRNTVILFTSV